MERRTLLKQMGAAAALAALPSAQACAAPSPTAGIFLNQVGYRPADAKVASISNLPVAYGAFRLRLAQSQAVILTGTLTAPEQDAASGDSIRRADFSGVTQAGLYLLEAAGRQTEPFAIGPDVYKEGLRIATRAFYGQRCGCPVDMGQGYRHGACHQEGAFHASSGRGGVLHNPGGWHDAGDYGRYIVNSGITTGTLLWAWELFPNALRGLPLGIPESGRGLPDFLAEVRWNLGWMLSLQDGDGGVWHKQTSERFCGFILPEADTLTSYVIGTGGAPYKSTAATGDLAAVAAIAARCYAPFDAAFSQTCLSAARRAWTWAIANNAVVFKNPAGVSTGEYGDGNVTDEVLWASAELWRTTGEPQFEKQFLASIGPDPLRTDVPGWGSVASMARWTYALAERPGSADVKDRIRVATGEAAARLTARAAANGYGNTLDLRDFGWGSNSTAANQSLLLLIADRFKRTPAAVQAAVGNLHYLLGRNCHGVSWVTHLGTKPFLHPHHRPSAADHIAEPWPGLLSGGPNGRPGDDVARRLPAGPPMRQWVDDERAYSLNEVAINWNAPLVFLLAALNDAKR